MYIIIVEDQLPTQPSRRSRMPLGEQYRCIYSLLQTVPIVYICIGIVYNF